MNKLNSNTGKLDNNTKNGIINNAVTNQSNNEVLTVDNQLNEKEGFEKIEMSEFRITNNKTGNIQRNESGFLVINDNKDGEIQAGLIAKKYNLEDVKEKMNTEIENLR